MILVDTNVLSELTRPVPEPRVIAWLEVNEPALALPAVALAELRYGIARLPDGRRRSGLLHFWRATCAQFRGRIFSSGSNLRTAAAVGAAPAQQAGRRPNTQSGPIAASELGHGWRAPTRNVGDFGATGVAIVNPWE